MNTQQALDLALGTNRWERRSGETEPDEVTVVVDPVNAEEYAPEVAAILEQYSIEQEGTFPAEALTPLLRRLQERQASGSQEPNEEEGLTRELGAVLDRWLDDAKDAVESPLTGALAALMLKGFTDTFNAWRKALNVKEALSLGITQQVRSWAKDLAGSLLDGLNRATRVGILGKIGKWLQKELSLGDIIARLREYLGNWFRDAKRLLAKAADAVRAAYHKAAYKASQWFGAQKKFWITKRDPYVCKRCRRNERQGYIRISQRFSSGHYHPPAHNWCRCRLHYAWRSPRRR